MLRRVLVLNDVRDIDGEVALLISLDELDQVAHLYADFLQLVQGNVFPEVRIGNRINRVKLCPNLLDRGLGLQGFRNLGNTYHALPGLMIRENLGQLDVQDENIKAKCRIVRHTADDER